MTSSEPKAADSPPKVDLVLVFRSGLLHQTSKYTSKQEIKENALDAQAEYERLLSKLQGAGLHATGRRGQKTGQLLVLIWAPSSKVARIVQRERHSDFLRGLPSSSMTTMTTEALSEPESLAPADRVRLIHDYITSTTLDGGLGIIPGSKDWKRVESIMALHDHDFNDMWLRSWTRRQIGFGIGIIELDKIKDEFGEAVALYFSFLSSYSTALIPIAIFGFLFFYLKLPYSPIYSAVLALWSVGFVEYWRIRQRILSIRWGTRGSFRAERRRAQYEDIIGGGKFPWWKRDLRILSSLPVILLFAGLLTALLTGIFIIEAFVTQLYTGPGQKYISYMPTVLFIALVPRLLAVYHSYAVRLTDWENHPQQSAHEASLTLKTFALSAIVAYLGLALSAFVYVPFGEYIMENVQQTLFASTAVVGAGAFKIANGTKLSSKATEQNITAGTNSTVDGLWASGAKKTNPTRLQSQMFAFTVTNQVIGAFLEVGLPWIQGKVDSFRSGGLKNKLSPSPSTHHTVASSSSNTAVSATNTKRNNGKRVVFEDEEFGEKVEREFLAEIRHEVSLPEYTLFADYSEMVTQFGYIALWSTIWPLAPLMALANNWLELRSDAFKVARQSRRPIPARTDTIGPWLDSLTFLTWLAALTNSALVYLFRPSKISETVYGTELDASHIHTSMPLKSSFVARAATSHPEYNELIVPAVLIALSASHGYILVRLFVRHVLERLLWKGSKEEEASEEADRLVKEQYLKSLGLSDEESVSSTVKDEGLGDIAFWKRDEGIDEIQKSVKDA
ncbi:DUF590-domain-containing protein [Schizopora paradoxa]|uniref:DUF590-domain-containing protein n=1 Tax=Schizopora paradoxa TaxID=27342 RepID=A0A0H2SPY6_9AGAM|nr:DUF590-domain-containing protein [Schizopora paradoxa]